LTTIAPASVVLLLAGFTIQRKAIARYCVAITYPNPNRIERLCDAEQSTDDLEP
jgi:hypothetical protein